MDTYELMHASETIAIAKRDIRMVDVVRPDKLPFGLRAGILDFDYFMDWLRSRVDNLQRTYMNKVYLARKIGRSFANILQDSCALSITDQFWIQRSDIEITWEKLQELRDKNETLANVALLGDCKT